MFGHFDGLAALIYMIRNVDVHTNPIPVILDITEVDHYISEDLKSQAEKPQKELVSKMLGLRGGQ